MDIYEMMIADLRGALSKLNKRNRNSLWLKELITPDTDGVVKCGEQDIIDMAVMPVIKGLQQKTTLADVAVTIGRKIRQKFDYEQDSLCSLFGGLLVLESFANVDFLGTKRTFTRGRSRQKHPPYHIYVKDWGTYQVFLDAIDVNKLEESPLKVPAADWQDGFHEDGKTIIRHGNINALKEFSTTATPLVLGAINKLQRTGYTINPEVFAVYQQCMKLTDGSSPFKFEKETNQEAQKSMKIEAQAIEEMANSNLNNAFFHRYSCDFRGRIYPGTAYLNEQSSDNAKGLLQYDHEVPFGPQGHLFLAIHTANSIGEDKLPLIERIQYVEDNAAEIISWAEDPMTNRGWMKTDKCWSALACAFEWQRYYKFVEEDGNETEDFMSALPIFIDGSNNGVQHLTALALDEKSAPLVNLVATEPGQAPGDIYMFIAERVWSQIEKLDADVPAEAKAEMQRLIDEVKVLKLKYENCTGGRKKRDEIYKEIIEWRTENRELTKSLWSTFWLRLQEKSKRRKAVKRPVMTLGYGVTLAGVREQMFDDTKELSDDMRYKEKMWVTPMGDLVYDTCYSELKGPAEMLTLFRSLAEDANNRDEFLSWHVPTTNFPVVQAYEAPTKTQVNATFQGQRLQLTVQRYEDMKLSRKDQLSGAAPNVVHSFDAAHLTMVVNMADFPVTMVHDSFGCHIGNMDKMFGIVRKSFIDFYDEDPLVQLLTQLDSLNKLPERGNLVLDGLMQSDFAFC